MAMARMTFTVPEGTKRRAQALASVNWSAVVAQAIEDRLAALETLEQFAKTSRLTQADVDELADLVNKRMAARYQKLRASSSTRTGSQARS